MRIWCAWVGYFMASHVREVGSHLVLRARHQYEPGDPEEPKIVAPRCTRVKWSKLRTSLKRSRYGAQYVSTKATVGVAGRTAVIAVSPV